MEMSLSQKIARFLEIVSYFLLVPASLIEIWALVVGLITLVSSKFASLILMLVVSGIYCFGTLLLYGYRKHSRGATSKTSAIFLWVGTIGFNSIPFFWMLIAWPSNNFTIQDKTLEFWFYNIIGCYLSVILLAITALASDLRREFK